MIVALHFDETDKSKPPRGPPGGLGGDSDPDGDGGGGPTDHSDPTWRPFHANQMGINGRRFGNNKELHLLDIPSAQTLREWKQHCIRAVAGPWHDVHATQTWVSETMDPAVPKENLRDSGALMHLDMMIATNLLEKFVKMKRNR
eukprot:8060547-Pyramimonas_sp.AAC.1